VRRADGEAVGREPVSTSESLAVSAGRIEFTGVVEGRPTRAVVSGWPSDWVEP
jgi:hypothetical protein